jgi:Mg-chelatase subunit ChlD
MKTIFNITLLIIAFTFLNGIGKAQTDIMMAIDKSGTMQTNDPENLRYDGARQLLTFLSNTSDNNKAGVVMFGNQANVALELGLISSDKAKIFEALPNSQSDNGWTELGLGIKLSLESLAKSSSKNKNIILLSDGIIEGNPDTRGKSKEAANKDATNELWEQILPMLRSQGIRVYSLGLFKDNSGEGLLKRIANETGGTYQKINNPSDFSKVYFDIFRRIEPPTNEINFSQGSSDVKIGPEDRGVIIVGKQDFTVTTNKSNKTIYPSDDLSTVQGVVVIPFKDKDGTTTVFIGRQKGTAPSEDLKDGLTLTSKSDGTIYVYKNWSFENLEDSLQRKLYFLNEVLNPKFRFDLSQNLSDEERTKLNGVIKAGNIEYVLINNDTPQAIPGKLSQENDGIYTFERTLDTAGNFTLDINIRDRNSTYRMLSSSFTVEAMSQAIIKLIDKDGKDILNNPNISIGDTVTAEIINNPEFFAKYPEYRALALKQVEFYFEPENSGKPVGIAFKNSGTNTGKFITDPITIDSEKFVFWANITDSRLLPQMTGQGNKPEIPLRTKITRELKVIDTWWLWAQRRWYLFAGLATVLSFILGLYKIGEIYKAHKAKEDVQMFALVPGKGEEGLLTPFAFKDIGAPKEGTVTFQTPDGKEKNIKTYYQTVGGAGSDASIKIQDLSNDNSVIEIGKNINGERYVRLIDDSVEVILGGERLEKEVPTLFNEDTELSIKNEQNEFINYIVKAGQPENIDEEYSSNNEDEY